LILLALILAPSIIDFVDGVLIFGGDIMMNHVFGYSWLSISFAIDDFGNQIDMVNFNPVFARIAFLLDCESEI